MIPSISISELSLEYECASATFAYLIENADTHTEKRALKRERDDVLAVLSSEITEAIQNGFGRIL
jgi:hypothetical protein